MVISSHFETLDIWLSDASECHLHLGIDSSAHHLALFYELVYSNPFLRNYALLLSLTYDALKYYSHLNYGHDVY